MVVPTTSNRSGGPSPSARPQLDLVADLHTRVAHRERAQGDLVGTGRFPARCDHRADRLRAVDRCERLHPQLAVVGHHGLPGDTRSGHHVGMGGNGLPEIDEVVALVEEADDRIERGAVTDRVRRHLGDRGRRREGGDQRGNSHGDRGDRRQDRHAGAPTHPAQGEHRSGAHRWWARHGDGDSEWVPRPHGALPARRPPRPPAPPLPGSRPPTPTRRSTR